MRNPHQDAENHLFTHCHICIMSQPFGAHEPETAIGTTTLEVHHPHAGKSARQLTFTNVYGKQI